VDWVIQVFSPKTLEIIPLNTLENMSAEQGLRVLTISTYWNIISALNDTARHLCEG
jgi:hypothetical protein